MKVLYGTLFLAGVGFIFAACAPSAEQEQEPETPATIDSGGWVVLFDGTSFDGWRGLGREQIPEGHW